MSPNLGNTKKMQNTCSQPGKRKKKCKNNAKKNKKNAKKNDSCAGKMTFLDFLGRLWVQPPALDEKTTKKNDKKMTTKMTAQNRNDKKCKTK